MIHLQFKGNELQSKITKRKTKGFTDKHPFIKYFTFFLLTIFCLASFTPVLWHSKALADPQAPPQGPYLFDKVITWSDGSTEQVQIGSDGFFRLNGKKQRLVGMCLSLLDNGIGPGSFYETKNLIILDKELTYMESIGIRLIRIDLGYVRWMLPEIQQEENAYKSILDLIYQHKMLLVAQIIGKSMPGFNNLENPDFSWNLNTYGGTEVGTDSMLAWAERWSGIVGSYQNVVAAVADNELDYKYKAKDLYYMPNVQDQNYTPEAVDRYLTLLTGILRQKINVPLTHNLMNNRTEPEIKRICLSKIDIPAFDFYAETTESLATNLSDYLTWRKVSSGWWCMELNHMYEKSWTIDVDGFNSNFIQTIFDHGAAVTILFWSNSYDKPEEAFFDNYGNAKPQLIEVAQGISQFQVTMDERQSVSIYSINDQNTGYSR